MAQLAKMADRAHEHGVTLCVKAHVGAAIYNTPTTLRAMEEIDSPGFGIDMDPSHIHRAGENTVEALTAVISRVKHVHIRDCAVPEGGPGDPELQACGRGDIDLFGYVRVLHESGLDVAANLEVIGAKEHELGAVATIAAESRGYLNACLKACGAGAMAGDASRVWAYPPSPRDARTSHTLWKCSLGFRLAAMYLRF